MMSVTRGLTWVYPSYSVKQAYSLNQVHRVQAKSPHTQKIAAIDAGSNAMRMLVGNINEAWEVEPIENVRHANYVLSASLVQKTKAWRLSLRGKIDWMN